MLNFLKGLLSSEKIVDAGIAAVDKAFYTEEEKEGDQQKRQEMLLRFVEASAPFEVSRRFIAVSVTGAWLVNGAMCMLAVIVELVLDYNQLPHPPLFQPVADFGLWYVMPPFTTITGFYFFKQIVAAKKK